MIKFKLFLISILYGSTTYYFKVTNISILYLLLLYLVYSTALLFMIKKEILATIANLYFSQGFTDKAVPFFEKATSLNTKNPTLYLNYSIYLLNNYEYKKGLDILLLTENLKASPITKKNIQITKASCFWLNGNVDDGIATLLSVINDYDYINPTTYTTLGYFYILKEDFSNATLFTNKALECDPSYFLAYDNFGQIDFIQNNFQDALKHFHKVIENYHFVDSYYYLATIYKQLGDLPNYEKFKSLALSSNINGMNSISLDQLHNL